MPLTMEELEFKFRWWCCLRPLERLQLTLCITEFQLLLGFIPRNIFDTSWTSLGGTIDDWQYTYFITVYPLTLGEFEDEQGNKIEVYFFDDFFWFEISAFSESDKYLCIQVCRILSYSNE